MTMRNLAIWRSALLGLALLAGTPSSHAQIKDQDQRRAWFYLQHLSIEAQSIEGCIALRTAESVAQGLPSEHKEAWAKFDNLTDELAREVERYVQKYGKLMTNEKSSYTFTHTVWEVVITVGQEKARKPTKESCDKLLPN